ncbi:hypothetical protein RvY_16950 [Ramazzottius varieornatus]|uniref:Uncharacterized protein n=1 Tax=Ramazzottius varieornatus TaxID=947166 RepID=A0A1D1W4J6_RAMVA|nr:hypothetical protein RvY_16950 [Ramazzottius varieornatus]
MQANSECKGEETKYEGLPAVNPHLFEDMATLGKYRSAEATNLAQIENVLSDGYSNPSVGL